MTTKKTTPAKPDFDEAIARELDQIGATLAETGRHLQTRQDVCLALASLAARLRAGS